VKTGMFGKLRDLVDGLTGKNRFGRFDSGTLKVMMMLAAVDGDVTVEEIGRFKEVMAKCRGYNGESFEILWESALRSAGYLLLQSRLLPVDELVDVFVHEAERDFVREVILEDSKDRELAFDRLVEMAAADGDYSEVERRCIEALAKRVKEARNLAIAARYPRATACQ